MNIIISAEVPDFFRKIHMNQLKSKRNIISLQDFFYEHAANKLKIDEKSKGILDSILKLRISTGFNFIPIWINNTNKYTISLGIGEYIQLYDRMYDSDNLVRYFANESNSNIDFKYFVNLIDGQIYDSFGVQKSVAESNETKDVIISQLKLQPIIDWFNEGQVFSEYFDLIDNEESTIELELYNLWIKHNQNLLNE